MAAADRRAHSKNAFDHVSPAARFIFYAGVFFVFAPFSLIYDLASPKGLSWTTLAVWAVYSGATAAGWTYGFTRNLRYLLTLSVERHLARSGRQLRRNRVVPHGSLARTPPSPRVTW